MKLWTGGLSAEQLQQTIAKHTEGTTPLSAQGTANLEANEWGAQWAELEEDELLEWPDEAKRPPSNLTVLIFRIA